MDNFKGGKFIVGTDLKADESKRMASELFRNQNENMRMVNENIRNETVLASKNSFFTQVGLFVTVLVIIVILTVIAILAYEKATNNQSLVDLDNLRDLKLSNLTVLDSSTLDDLTVKGTDIVFKEDITADKDINLAGGISVTGSGNYDGTLTVDGLLTANGGLSVAGGMSVYSKVDFYNTLNVTGSAQYDSTLNVDGLLTANGGLSVAGGMSVYSKVDFYNTLNVTGSAQYDSTLNVDGLLTANGGLSVVGGLSVAGGMSVSGGLSVTGTTTLEKARIKKKDVVYSSSLTGGVCNNHYTLSETSETGQTILVDYRITPGSGTSIDNTFVLPNLTSANTGVNYEFIWSGNNLSGTSTIFSLILDHTDSSNIYGIVNAGQNNSQPETLTLIGDKRAAIEHDSIASTASKAFHYTGKIYPGSKINCLKDDTDWLITGNLGVCDPVDITTDGFINTNNFSQIIFNNNLYNDHPKAFGSFYNEKFLPYQTNLPNITDLLYFYIKDINFGSEGTGSALWFLSGQTGDKNGGISGVIYSSTSNIEWTQTDFITDTPNDIQGVAYGTSSDGTDIWLAYGQSQGNKGAIYYSSTGDNWRGASLPSDYSGDIINSISYGTSDGTCTFVAVNGSTNSTTSNIYYSTNGTSFQNSSLASAAGLWKSVAYGLSDNGTSGLWVAGGTSVLMYYSENAIDWQPTTGISGSGANFLINSIAFGSSGASTRWVATTGSITYGTSIWYSENGTFWQNSNFINSFGFSLDCKVKFGRFLNDQKLWYLYAEDNGDLYNSTNGIEWNKIDSPFAYNDRVAMGFNQPLYPLENNAYDS